LEEEALELEELELLEEELLELEEPELSEELEELEPVISVMPALLHTAVKLTFLFGALIPVPAS